MRKFFFLGFSGLILVGIMLSLRSAGATPTYAQGLGVASDTPTATATTTGTPGPISFPMIFRQPTRTPTATATPTKTPTPTSTNPPTATQPPITTGLTGQTMFKENKPTYATFIENVNFYENIFNPTGGTIYYGILGVNTQRPNGTWMPFKTSWDGGGAPGGRLQIWAGCHGPGGGVCAPNADAGRAEDHVGSWPPGVDSPWEVDQVGQYRIELWVCYSTFTGCQQSGGVWTKLGTDIAFNAINWTPSAPDEVTEPAPTPQFSADYGPICYLITDQPGGTYLSCEKPMAKHRPAPRHP